MTEQPSPPQNLDAERALLGACLLSKAALEDAEDILTAGDFYRPAHGDVFTAALAVRDSGTAPDPISVADELTRRGQLVKVGGGVYLHTLLASTPVGTNAGYYAEQVAAAALRRRLAEAGERATQLAHSADDPARAVEVAHADLDRVALGVRAGVESSDIESLATEALVRYGSEVAAGLATPWHDLNDCLNGGLRPGTLTVVGARPGLGKSALGTQLCTHVALGGAGALLVSLEMPEHEVTDRIISCVSRTSYSRLLTRNLEAADWARVESAVDKLAGLPLRVVDTPYLGLTAVRSLARSMARQPSGLALLVIDYIQLMQPADPRAVRQEQVAGLSRGLKLLAKELAIPVVALAQLNRGPEQRTDKRPTMSDLRESGSIEQDADHVVLLHRDETDQARMGEMDLLLTKNRGGATATITVIWAPHFQTIRSLAAP